MKSISLILLLCISPIWSIRDGGARIVGGQSAYAGQFPYAAAIYKTTADGNYFCTGSLLHEEWVLTAAQCADGATLLTVLLGTHLLDGDDATVERLATDTYFLHPDYDPITLANDIALIKFRIPVMFNNYIVKLYLSYFDVDDGTTGTAYGWGQSSDANSALSNTLQYVTLSAVSDAQCRLTYGGQIAENMVCFEGGFNEGACFGDAGSPITHYISRGYNVVSAIATFFSSNGCESTDPSGYTRVFPYNDWIRNVTGGVV